MAFLQIFGARDKSCGWRNITCVAARLSSAACPLKLEPPPLTFLFIEEIAHFVFDATEEKIILSADFRFSTSGMEQLSDRSCWRFLQ